MRYTHSIAMCTTTEKLKSLICNGYVICFSKCGIAEGRLVAKKKLYGDFRMKIKDHLRIDKATVGGFYYVTCSIIYQPSKLPT